MKFDFNETLARGVLIFLLGIAMSVILNRLDWPEGVWKDVLTGASAVALSEVFFGFSSNQRKND